MKQLKQYVLVAAGDGNSGGQILVGANTHVNGSVAASDVVGVAEGAEISGRICAEDVNSARAVSQEKAADKSACPQLPSLHHEIRQLSTSLKHINAVQGAALGAQTLQAGPAIHVRDLVLRAGDTLWIEGAEGQRQIINVFGDAVIEQGAAVRLRGGIRPYDVFFNFIQNENVGRIDIGTGQLVGTYISEGRAFRLTDQSALQESRFYTTANIQIIDLKQEQKPVIQAEPAANAHVLNVSEPWSAGFVVLFALIIKCATQHFKSK